MREEATGTRKSPDACPTHRSIPKNLKSKWKGTHRGDPISTTRAGPDALACLVQQRAFLGPVALSSSLAFLFLFAVGSGPGLEEKIYMVKMNS
jgi:hypothetical protein